MKFDAKSFVAGMMITVIGISTVYAAGQIKSAQFNSNKVVFNGRQLNLTQPMISVVKEGEDGASNYMPVRTVLEAMGYQVEWDSAASAVVISDTDKKLVYDTMLDGETLKDTINARLNIDMDKLRSDGVFDEFNQCLNMTDPELMCILMVDDYNTWLNDGESLFPDMWELLFANK